MSEEKGDKWEMPKPIFRQSSGSRPEGFAKKIQKLDTPGPEANRPDPADDILATLYAPPDDILEMPPIVPAITPEEDIEPQPNISEQFTVDEMTGEPTPKLKSKRGFFGKVFLILGVLILLAIGFVALIIYLFFSSPPQNSNF